VTILKTLLSEDSLRGNGAAFLMAFKWLNVSEMNCVICMNISALLPESCMRGNCIMSPTFGGHVPAA